MTTSETIAEIVECMRGRGEDTRMDAALWRRYADRIEAAWKRERTEIEAAALFVGGAVEGARNKPPVSNVAAMREALVALRDAARNFCHQILNSKYNDIMDEYKCRERGFPALLDLRYAIPKASFALSAPAPTTEKSSVVGNMAEMREALESAHNWCLNRLGNASYQVTVEGLLSVVNAALAAPPRNCDRYATLREAVLASGLATADALALTGMSNAQLVAFVKWLYDESERGGAE